MKTILIVSDYYLPGYKAGGPIRTLVNMVSSLNDIFSFKVITADHDWGESIVFPNIQQNNWQKVGDTDVFYASLAQLNLILLRKALNETSYDLIYLNSFFSPLTIKVLILRKLGLISSAPVVLAPRGEFSPGALKLKAYKKRPYLLLAKYFGLYKNLVWHVSSEYEQQDLLRWLRVDLNRLPHTVVIAPNIADAAQVSAYSLKNKKTKEPGSLSIVFLSRISRKKNLDGALKILAKGINGAVDFNIYGPIEDAVYWNECQHLIERLPKNINVQYCGSLEPSIVQATLTQHEVFFLPTLGENFGHVILEALSAGCPIVISDQTPWRNLNEKGIGCDIALNQSETFQNALQKFVDMNAKEFNEWSCRALEFAKSYHADDANLKKNRRLFMDVLDRID